MDRAGGKIGPNRKKKKNNTKKKNKYIYFPHTKQQRIMSDAYGNRIARSIPKNLKRKNLKKATKKQRPRAKNQKKMQKMQKMQKIQNLNKKIASDRKKRARSKGQEGEDSGYIIEDEEDED